MISIIIPNYNSFKSLKKLIKSIPEQKNIEIIIIDDNSEEKIEFIRKDVKIYINNSGIKGAGQCRNIGLQNSKGEWLIFADADDYFLEGAFQIINEELENVTQDTDIIFFEPTSKIKEEAKKGTRHLHHKKLLKKKDLESIKYEFHEPWSKLIRLSLVKTNKIKFTPILVSNDIFFTKKIAFYSEKIKLSKKKIYCIVENRNSLTSNENLERLKIRIKELIQVAKFMKEKKINKKYHVYFLGIIVKISKYNKKIAFKYLLKCIRNKYKILPPYIYNLKTIIIKIKNQKRWLKE